MTKIVEMEVFNRQLPDKPLECAAEVVAKEQVIVPKARYFEKIALQVWFMGM